MGGSHGPGAESVRALKYWQGADGHMYANLFTVNRVFKLRSKESYFDWSEAGMVPSKPQPQQIPWEQYEEINHELGVCPVVTIQNKPTLARGGVSDLENLVGLQRGIDAVLKNMLLATEFAAYPQRYALNVAVERDQNGKVSRGQSLEASMSRMWMIPPPEDSESPEAKVGACC